jgi:hypothetical protein
METPFPLASLEIQQHLAPAVEISEPLWMLSVLEVFPGIVVNLFKPVKTLLGACKLISLNHCYQGLNMNPP